MGIMITPHNQVICPVCQHSYYLTNGFCVCQCGGHPIQIIASKYSDNFALQKLIRKHKIDLSLSDQFRLYYYFSRASENLSRKGVVYFFDKLPDEKKFLTAGSGSEESLREAFDTGIINPSGEDIVIPLTVFGKYYTGFIIIKENKIKIHHLIPDFGYAFSYTLYDHGPEFPQHIFLFQNPLSALRIICRYYDITGTFPPVIAEPHLNISNSLDTLPGFQLIYVVESLSHKTVPDLYQYRALICKESIAQNSDPCLQLRTYLKKATPIRRHVVIPVSPDFRTRIMVISSMWLAIPRGTTVCNCDVLIRNRYLNRNSILYEGVIRYGGKRSITFWWDGTKPLLSLIREICVQHNIPFQLMPSFEKKFEKFVFLRSGPIKTSRLCYKLKQKRILVLPEIVITDHGVIPSKYEFPAINYPGAGVKGEGKKHKFQEPLLPQNINQLLTFLAVATSVCRSLMTTNANSKFVVGTFLFGPHDHQLLEFLNVLGVPHYPSTEPSPNGWPVFYSELPKTLFTSPFNYPYVALVNSLELAVAMCLKPITVFGITDHWHPMYNINILRDNLIAFLQYLLCKHKDKIGSTKKLLKNFVEFFEFPPEVETALKDRMIPISHMMRFYQAAKLIVELAKIGEYDLPSINKPLIKPFNIVVDPREINDRLQKLGYPRVLSEKSPKIYVNSVLIQYCLNSPFYDMRRKKELRQKWEQEFEILAKKLLPEE